MYSPLGLKSAGPVSSILNVCSQLGILNLVKAAVEDNGILSLSQWKTLVKCKIWDYENKMWQIRSRLYSSMSYVRCTPMKVEMSPWYKYLNYNPT